MILLVCHLRLLDCDGCVFILRQTSDSNSNGPLCNTYARCQSAWYGRITASTPGRSHQLFEDRRAGERAISNAREITRCLVHSPYKLAITAYNNLASHILPTQYLQLGLALVALRWDRTTGLAVQSSQHRAALSDGNGTNARGNTFSMPVAAPGKA